MIYDDILGRGAKWCYPPGGKAYGKLGGPR